MMKAKENSVSALTGGKNILLLHSMIHHHLSELICIYFERTGSSDHVSWKKYLTVVYKFGTNLAFDVVSEFNIHTCVNRCIDS